MISKLAGSKKCGCGKVISANALTCRACAATARSGDYDGCLEILNVQGGDVRITFDRQDVAETIRAKRIIADMLRRGYALVVEVERDGVKAYERVQGFDEARGEYVICDFDPMAAREADHKEEMVKLKDVYEKDFAADPENISAPAPEPGKKRTKRLPMEGTKATGIGRSAGG